MDKIKKDLLDIFKSYKDEKGELHLTDRESVELQEAMRGLISRAYFVGKKGIIDDPVLREIYKK